MRDVPFFLLFAILSLFLIHSDTFTQPTADDSLKVTVVDVGAVLCCVVRYA